MIDIHPTHHGSFTLREFFIHLFIVVLGILIAIGLEQAVEYFHHRGQRDDLIRQMRTEAQHNLSIFQTDQRIDITRSSGAAAPSLFSSPPLLTRTQSRSPSRRVNPSRLQPLRNAPHGPSPPQTARSPCCRKTSPRSISGSTSKPSERTRRRPISAPPVSI